MKEKREGRYIFTPSEQNRVRLDYAKAVGLDMAKVVNDVLENHLHDYLVNAAQQKAKDLQKLLADPVP